eukprot:6027479-Prymnesium_polylepis.1
MESTKGSNAASIAGVPSNFLANTCPCARAVLLNHASSNAHAGKPTHYFPRGGAWRPHRAILNPLGRISSGWPPPPPPLPPPAQFMNVSWRPMTARLSIDRIVPLHGHEQVERAGKGTDTSLGGWVQRTCRLTNHAFDTRGCGARTCTHQYDSSGTPNRRNCGSYLRSCTSGAHAYPFSARGSVVPCDVAHVYVYVSCVRVPVPHTQSSVAVQPNPAEALSTQRHGEARVVQPAGVVARVGADEAARAVALEECVHRTAGQLSRAMGVAQTHGIISVRLRQCIENVGGWSRIAPVARTSQKGTRTIRAACAMAAC